MLAGHRDFGDSHRESSQAGPMLQKSHGKQAVMMEIIKKAGRSIRDAGHRLVCHLPQNFRWEFAFIPGDPSLCWPAFAGDGPAPPQI